MKKYLLSLFASLLFATSSQAALVNNGTFTTDSATGLDWLDVTITADTVYNDAEALNPGWRYATNVEVEQLFQNVFFDYVDTDVNQHIGSYFVPLFPSSYDLFQFYFGATSILNFPVTTKYTLGMYLDEDDILRTMGSSRISRLDLTVYSDEYTAVYDPNLQYAEAGVFLVRNPVPLPGAVWLFGSGLLGLVAVARRKKGISDKQ